MTTPSNDIVDRGGKRYALSDSPETIWLEAQCAGDLDQRHWAADNPWGDECLECGSPCVQYVRQDIYADRIQALEAENAGLRSRGWRVKPLEWENFGMPEIAISAVGVYKLWANHLLETPPPSRAKQFETAIAAKTAAQADYEARIISALEPGQAGSMAANAAIRAVIDYFQLWKPGEGADDYNVAADHLAALIASHTASTKYYFDEAGKPTQVNYSEDTHHAMIASLTPVPLLETVPISRSALVDDGAGEGDWQLAAFDTTIALAQKAAISASGATGLAHLMDMRARIEPTFSAAKLGRWLGWAQCAVVAAGAATLGEMKEVNRQASNLSRLAALSHHRDDVKGE